ncbi:hypothetical protein, partial [Mycobacterium marinum]|uniref:hypothetical protein n=1 Tax=Mycobacterium marinum TaxID=1781 RepID=UPI0021C2CE13
HLNTGGFNQGSQNNGFFWRGDAQGQIGFDYTITIPEIGLGLNVDVPLNIPLRGTIGTLIDGEPIISVTGFTIPALHLDGTALSGTIGPIVVDPITITGPQVDLMVGGPGESLQLALSGPGVGPVVIPVAHVPAVAGFGNTTSAPSSGFFN